LTVTLRSRLGNEIDSYSFFNFWRGARAAEWGALLRRCPGKPDRGFKSLPLRQFVFVLVCALVSSFVILPMPVSASSCTVFNQARANDSWSRIAARYDMSLKRLLALNSAKTSTMILVGKQICTSDQPVIVIPDTTYKRKDVVAIIREVWPDEHEENALFVAQRESKLRPNVVGGSNDCCMGLFQIFYSVHRSWLKNLGVTEPAQLLDPRVNAEAAFALFKRNGNSWKPWWTKSWRP
jgi:hypothetical protein